MHSVRLDRSGSGQRPDYAITSLTNDTAYEVQVWATNGISPGSGWSDAVSVTPAELSSCDDVWSATLTAKQIDENNTGCSTSASGKPACSDTEILSDDWFVHKGIRYEFKTIVSTSDNPRIVIDKPQFPVSGLTLHLVDTTYS